MIRRNKAKLSAAQKEFTTYARSRPNQSSAPTVIHVLSLDLSLDFGVIEESINKHVAETSAITNLFLCAGSGERALNECNALSLKCCLKLRF